MWPRRLVTTGAAVMLAVTGLAVESGTAQAGSGFPPCGNTCNGKDPQNYIITAPGGPGHYYSCAEDAVTVGSFVQYGRTVQLRYSNRCETVWGRIYNTHLDDTLYIEAWQGDIWLPQTQWTREYRKVSDAYTPMWNDHDRIDRICFRTHGHIGDPRDRCTRGW